MARTRELEVRILADTRGYNRAMVSSSLSTGKLESSMDRFKRVAADAFKVGAFAAGVFAVKIGIDSVKAASDLGEQINKTRVVFRGSEKDILQWSKTTAFGIGISRRAALEAAGTFGNMLVPMGFARDRAEEMSKRMVQLASDMASFNNVPTAEALDAIRSGIAGETEPLRRLGVDLRVAALEHFALSKGIKTAYQEMTNNQKATLAYQKILNDTKDAQGDFHRTSGSLANSSRALGAAWEDLQAKLGKKLLPLVTDGVRWLLRFIRQMETGKGAGGDFARAMENIGKALSDTVKYIKAVDDAGDDMRHAFFNAWQGIKKSTGDAIAFILRGFAKVFEAAGHIPGVGGKFDDLARDANRAADKVDRVGEEIKRVKSKRINFNVDVGVKLRTSPQLQDPRDLLGTGDGWGIESAVTDAAKGFGRKKAREMPVPAILPGRGGGGDLMGASPILAPFAAFGAQYGLEVTSGYRPGSITSSGNVSYHASGHAIDVNKGTASGMLAYGLAMAKLFGGRLKELIHTPMGFSIKNGARVAPYAAADHYDHVHVAMQRGGRLPGGRSGDRNIAALEDGEFVVNRKATAAFGPLLESINKGIPRFQKGGLASLNKTFPRHGLSDAAGHYQMSERGVRMVAEAAGFSPGLAVQMAQIARGESTYYPGIVSFDGGYGLWQMTPRVWGPEAVSKMNSLGGTTGMLNPLRNAKMAKWLYDQAGGFGPWFGTAFLDRDMDTSGVRSVFGAGGPPSGAGDTQKDMDRTRPGVQRLTPAERRERTPVHGRRTTADIIAGRQDFRHEQRWEGLQNIGEGGITPREERQATRAYSGRAKVLNARIKVARTRLHKINRALAGKLRPETRTRLLAEKASLMGNIQGWIGELKTLTRDYRDLTTPEDAGDGGTGNQLADDLTAAAAAKQEQEDDDRRRQEELAAAIKELATQIQRQNDFATSVANITGREAVKALGDVISGQIGVNFGQRRQTAGSGVLARY